MPAHTSALLQIIHLSLLLILQSIYNLPPTGAASWCDWRSQSNSYVIKAILESKLEANVTILWELAGIFANKENPLQQVVVHYKILMPLNKEEECDGHFPDCELAYQSNDFDCPVGYSCIALDYIWGNNPMSAQDIVFRDLDVCSLVIGEYNQREVTIYFELKSPPSCNSSSVSTDAINKEQFPCGWSCNMHQINYPHSGKPDEAFFQSVRKETPLETSLTFITAKLLIYGTVKEVVGGLEYESTEALGFGAKLNDVHPAAKHGIFLTSYVFLNIVLFMLMYRYKSRFYNAVFNYATKDMIKFSLFWSAIVTFFLACINITFMFAIEGGICITLLQLYMIFISLTPGVLYLLIAVFSIKRKSGFFNLSKNLICARVPFIDHLMQILVLCFLYTLPHVVAIIVYFLSISFFDNTASTTILLLYFSSSSIILWIANAVVVYLISPYLFICRCSPVRLAAQRIFFAVCLGLSLNLMNISILPLIGDYFYSAKVGKTAIFALVPIALTVVGWYLSGDFVKLFTVLSFDNAHETKPDAVDLASVNGDISINHEPESITLVTLANGVPQDDTSTDENLPKFRSVAQAIEHFNGITIHGNHGDHSSEERHYGNLN